MYFMNVSVAPKFRLTLILPRGCLLDRRSTLLLSLKRRFLQLALRSSPWPMEIMDKFLKLRKRRSRAWKKRRNKLRDKAKANKCSKDLYFVHAFKINLQQVLSKIVNVKNNDEVFLIMVANSSGTQRSQLTVVMPETCGKSVSSVNLTAQPANLFVSDDNLPKIFERWLLSVKLPSPTATLYVPAFLYRENPSVQNRIYMEPFPENELLISEFVKLYQNLLLEDLFLFCESSDDVIEYIDEFSVKSALKFLHKTWLNLNSRIFNEIGFQSNDIDQVSLDVKRIFESDFWIKEEIDTELISDKLEAEEVVVSLRKVIKWSETQPIHFSALLLLWDLAIFAKQVLI